VLRNCVDWHLNATLLPAAAWYLSILLCAVFPRAARKNRTQMKYEVPHERKEPVLDAQQKTYVIKRA